MLKQQFIQLVKKPNSPIISGVELLNDLELLVKEYPYFQTAHLLYTKELQKTNAINYAKQLRKTAVLANSRAILYELIHNENTVTEIAPIDESTVSKEKISDSISSKGIENVITEEADISKKTSSVSITNNDIKIVYVNTIPSKSTELDTNEGKTNVEVVSTNTELNILKDVENETTESIEKGLAEFDNETEPVLTQAEIINKQIETEISRGIIHSFVETDIIKTPELTKEIIEEPLNFTSWLQKVKKESGIIQKTEPQDKKITENEALVQKTEKSSLFKQNKQLIDKIIDLDPGRIKLGNQKFFTPYTEAKQSLLENEHLVTETLAKIYALQGNNSKAIRAYEILSLKFPQKSVYFTTLIEKLKNNK